MTYSTPASFVRAGQHVFFVYFSFFFLGVHGPAEAPFDIPRTLTDTLGARLKPEASNTSFLASSCASSSFLTFQVLFQLFYFTSHNLPQVLHLPTHLLPLLLSITSLLCQAVPLVTQILHVPHHLICLCHEGSGDGRRERTAQGHRGKGLARLQEGNWHKERIYLELGQEPLLPEPVQSPLTGTFVLVTPKEPQGDFKHISTFYGGYGIRQQDAIEDESL